MKYRDPLQYNQTMITGKSPDKKTIALIIVSVIAFVEFGFLIFMNQKPKQIMVETTGVTTEESLAENIATEIVTTEATTEVITEVTTEAITEATTEVPPEVTTEAPVNELTTREYYNLFNGYLENYNAHNLVESINVSYLPELRDVIFTQTLQSVNASDEAEYWNILTAQYGGSFTCSFTPTEEKILGEETRNLLQTQLAEYGYKGEIEQCVSVQVTRTTVLSESGQLCAEAYNRYVIVKTDSGWWIVGKQAQSGES